MNKSFHLPDKEVAVALMAADLQYQMDSTYQAALKRIVFCPENPSVSLDQKGEISAQSKLSTNAAKHALTYIWQNSDEVSKEALAISGYPHSALEGDLTSRALAKTFHKITAPGDFDAVSRIEQDMRRIVDAARAYRLLDDISNPQNNNSRPFAGTNLLHRLLAEVHIANAKLINGLRTKTDSMPNVRGGV